MDAKQFGKYISNLRLKRGLTIRTVDQMSGVSHSYISQLETGNRDIPSPDILRKLSFPLGVDYMELMFVAGYVEREVKVERSNLHIEIDQLREENAVLRQTIKDLSKLI